MLDAPKRKNIKLAGFDPGRQYIAWAVIRGTPESGWKLYRHGFIYPPELGNTASFGSGLLLWGGFFDHFVKKDLCANYCATERFIKMQGAAGSGAEDINLRVSQMARPGMSFVRNVDWKSWFKRTIHKDGAPAVFKTPTEHEADAAGIALYLGSVLLPRMKIYEPRDDNST